MRAICERDACKGPFLDLDAVLLVEMSVRARALCGRGVTNALQLISRSDDRGATLQSMGPRSQALA